jgi:hypothetical protein
VSCRTPEPFWRERDELPERELLEPAFPVLDVELLAPELRERELPDEPELLEPELLEAAA